MKWSVFEKNAQAGSYRRGDLRGDVLGAVYSYAEVSGIMIPGHVAFRDGWAERLRKQNTVCSETFDDYVKKLNGSLSPFAADENATPEQIYAAVRRLRREVFGQKTIDAADRMAARESAPDPDKMDIDQTAQGARMLGSSRCALFVLADPRLAALMQADLNRAREQGRAVYAAFSEEDGLLLPSRSVMAELAEGARLISMSDEGNVDGDEALAEAAAAGGACLFYYGETGLTRCRSLAIPALVTCAPESLTARALSGQFTRQGLCAVYVPAGFDIVPFVPMARRTLASYRQFARLCDAHGEEVYGMSAQALYERWPEMFFSVYDETDSGLFDGLRLPDDPSGAGGWYAGFCRRRDMAIEAWLNAMPGVRSLSGWFELDTLAQKPVPWDAAGEARGILVHGVVAGQAAGACARLSDGQPISPRMLLQDESDPPRAQVISNYLFFLTPRLAEFYNRLRAARPQEQSAMRGGHLDYMLFHDANGGRTETFPLYRKACMGLTEDGRFVFFHFRLRGGDCAINGQTIAWTAADVDPDAAGDTAVYTPYISCADAGANRFEYVKSVGEGRVNFVINQTELTCVRDGDVLLPGTGVVLSLSRERGLALARACGFVQADNGYFSWRETPRLCVRLQNPEEIAPETWRGVQWAYGGGLTLIQNGESVFRRGEDASGALAREGWASPLSAQTQESDIAALARHPRTAIGLTRAGALLILVFSGRSSVSAGADYVEMCEIARRLAPDVTDLMNVDGGGSAVLGIAAGQRFVEYSWPSSSFDSLPGMVRPVNSLFSVTLER